MAENKKGIIIYVDLIHTIKKVIEKDRLNGTNNSGELFYHLLEYVNDLNPEPINDIVDFLFEPIKQQLKRDLVKWEQFREKQSQNGKLGGRPKNPDVKTENPENPSLNLKSQKSLKVTVKDIVTVTDTVKEKVNNSYTKDKKDAAKSAAPSDFTECIEVYNNFIKELTGGAGAKIDGVQGKAMISIIKYVKTQMKDPASKVADSLAAIFNNWKKLEPFLQNQTTLTAINSKLQDIIIQIKNNGKSTVSEPKYGRIKVSDLKKFRDEYSGEEYQQERD